MDFRTFVEDRSTVNVFPVEKDPECFSKQLKHLPLDRSDFSLVTFQAAAPAPNESLEIANSLKNVGKNSALGLTKEAIQMDGADFDSIDKLPARALLPYLVKSGEYWTSFSLINWIKSVKFCKVTQKYQAHSILSNP